MEVRCVTRVFAAWVGENGFPPGFLKELKNDIGVDIIRKCRK